MVDGTMKTVSGQAMWFATDNPQKINPETNRWRLSMRQHVWRPPTDVYETEGALIVRVEVAGMEESDFSIVLEDRYLLIRGVRPDSQERKAYQQMEIPFGEFGTEVELPFAVLAQEIEAIYKDGFLRIVLPKMRPYQVKIEE